MQIKELWKYSYGWVREGSQPTSGGWVSPVWPERTHCVFIAAESFESFVIASLRTSDCSRRTVGRLSLPAPDYLVGQKVLLSTEDVQYIWKFSLRSFLLVLFALSPLNSSLIHLQNIWNCLRPSGSIRPSMYPGMLNTLVFTPLIARLFSVFVGYRGSVMLLICSLFLPFDVLLPPLCPREYLSRPMCRPFPGSTPSRLSTNCLRLNKHLPPASSAFQSDLNQTWHLHLFLICSYFFPSLLLARLQLFLRRVAAINVKINQYSPWNDLSFHIWHVICVLLGIKYAFMRFAKHGFLFLFTFCFLYKWGSRFSGVIQITFLMHDPVLLGSHLPLEYLAYRCLHGLFNYWKVSRLAVKQPQVITPPQLCLTMGLWCFCWNVFEFSPNMALSIKAKWLHPSGAHCSLFCSDGVLQTSVMIHHIFRQWF